MQYLLHGALVISLAGSATAAAQSLPTPNPAAPVVSTWRFESGYTWFALRDVARTTHPVDASLVAWEGDGVVVEGQYLRRRGSRLQRVDVALAFANDFAYRSPLSVSAKSSADHYRDLDARYEYRRYPFRNAGIDGLDIGIGVQAIGAFTASVRHVPVDLVSEYQTAGVGPGLVLVASLHRWSRAGGDVSWTNAAMFTRVTGRDGDAFTDIPARSGGGWISHLKVSAAIRLSQRTQLAISWDQSRDGMLSTHQTWTTTHGSLIAGVTYAK
jgi:hypothetical protein